MPELPEVETIARKLKPDLDPRPPFVTSGLRVGTPAITTRGFREAESRQVGDWIADVLDGMGDESVVERVRGAVLAICSRFPVYG